MNGIKLYSRCSIWCKNMWNLYLIVHCIRCLCVYWHIVIWWIAKVITGLESYILVLNTLLVSSSKIMIKYIKIIWNDQQRILKKFSSGKSETTLNNALDLKFSQKWKVDIPLNISSISWKYTWHFKDNTMYKQGRIFALFVTYMLYDQQTKDCMLFPW